uniref:Wax ester synthase/diacylglycerol acyltransferase n=1 Tax=Euglena gracilis TaxID=3039 RepID=A0A1E1GJD2_EUGGR|nr:wax ester synthase/diacylglycerol acyltransferase [Euglena gracilis]
MVVAETTPVANSISVGDLFWWRIDEPTNPMVISVILGMDGTISLAELRDALRPHVEDNIRLQGTPQPNGIYSWRPYFIASVLLSLVLGWALRSLCCFSYIVAFGLLVGIALETRTGRQWRWVKVKDFALEDHIKLHVLPEETLECLHGFIDELASTQLPRDRAQWMVYLIHNAPGGSRILFRFHHIVGDGAGLGIWFYNLCTNAEQKKQDMEARHELLAKSKARRAENRTKPSPLAKLDGFVSKVLLILGGTTKLLFLPRDSNSPVKGANVGKKKTAVTGKDLLFPLEEVKHVGKALHPNITVNDTMCALVGGAFRRYYQSLHLHPEQMLMRATVPINIRPSTTAPIKMENDFTIVFKSLPIHLPTPEERIAHFHVRMGFLKRGIEPLLSMFLQHLLTWLPEPLMRLIVLRFTICSSAVLTNVLSSTVPFSLCGQPLTTAAFWVPTSGDIGIGISIMTYCDTVAINFIADENLIADWAPVVQFMREEWEEMKGILGKEQHLPVMEPQKTVELVNLWRTWGFPWNTR